MYCKEFYWTMQTLIEVGSQYDRDINKKKNFTQSKNSAQMIWGKLMRTF